MSELKWIEPWEAVERETALLLAEELRREVGSGHPLFGCVYDVIARRVDCDDIAIRLDSGHFAVVHLTWSGKSEQSPAWPAALIYEDVEELLRRIWEDHQEYVA